MPPILMRDYNWRQTPWHVYVTVQWPTAITAKRADVYANDVYVKVHAAPHLFELDLAYEIDDQEATCTIEAQQVTLKLPKLVPNVNWDLVQFRATVTAPGNEGTKLIHERREDARTRHLQRQQAAREKRNTEKWEKQRYLVRQQMEVERIERDRLANLKKQEKEIAERGLHDWAETARTGNLPIEQELSSGHEAIALAARTDDMQHVNHESSDDDDQEIQSLRAKYAQIKLRQEKGLGQEVDQDMNTVIPAPRQRGEIKIQFTPRQFVTAARETQDAKWAAQMEEARRKRNLANEETIQLEDKATALQSQGQWLLAIDAYSALIVLTPMNHRAFVGRCECYAQIGYHELAAQDARQALGLIEEMEQKHDIRGVYDQPKAQLRMRLAEEEQWASCRAMTQASGSPAPL